MLGMPLDQVIQETILALRKAAGPLGLDGSLARQE